MTNVVRGSGEIYFDTLTMLVFLLLGGRWLQSRHQRLALDAVELLFSVMPRTSCVIDADGERREVASDALEPGMVVEIRANDTVPADGIIVTGEATLDESILTGESTPVVRRLTAPSPSATTPDTAIATSQMIGIDLVPSIRKGHSIIGL